MINKKIEFLLFIRCKINYYSALSPICILYDYNVCTFFFSALDKIIVQGYKTLQLEYFFTAGPDEVKAWTILVCVEI